MTQELQNYGQQVWHEVHTIHREVWGMDDKVAREYAGELTYGPLDDMRAAARQQNALEAAMLAGKTPTEWAYELCDDGTLPRQ